MSLVSECPFCQRDIYLGDERCPSCGELVTGDAPVEESQPAEGEFDYAIEQIGKWSQIKHEIVDKYASAYMTVLANQSFVRKATYIDAFAGSGFAEDRDSGELVYGSAARAIATQPPFTEIHLVERDAHRVASLRSMAAGDPRVSVHHGDAVDVLTSRILPTCQYKQFARALCLLDPYGLTVPWSLLETIGQMRSVEIFFNFMVVSANRNVLWRDPARVSEKRRRLLDRVWGDRSWQDVLYTTVGQDLFGTDIRVKASNENVVEAFRERLQSKAGFAYVPRPIPITNSRGATIYYLFFASPNKTGNKIVTDIFSRYRR